MALSLSCSSSLKRMSLAASIIYASVTYTQLVVDGDFGALTFTTISITLLVPLIVSVLVVFVDRISAAFVLLLIVATARIVGRLTNGYEAFDVLSLITSGGDVVVLAVGVLGLRRHRRVDSKP